jgi:antitoxin component YwqK of YwqJK toxin-antitoxin module
LGVVVGLLDKIFSNKVKTKTGSYKSGQKKYEGNLKNGKKNGIWTYWHDNGQKEWEGNYKDGKEEGRWIGWHRDGRKWWEETYKNGELVEEE